MRRKTRRRGPPSSENVLCIVLCDVARTERERLRLGTDERRTLDTRDLGQPTDAKVKNAGKMPALRKSESENASEARYFMPWAR